MLLLNTLHQTLSYQNEILFKTTESLMVTHRVHTHDTGHVMLKGIELHKYRNEINLILVGIGQFKRGLTQF